MYMLLSALLSGPGLDQRCKIKNVFLILPQGAPKSIILRFHTYCRGFNVVILYIRTSAC